MVVVVVAMVIDIGMPMRARGLLIVKVMGRGRLLI